MLNRRAADIILAALTTWSTTIMTDNPKTCVDPYLNSFAQSFAAANYAAGTIRDIPSSHAQAGPADRHSRKFIPRRRAE